jgi:hypothetical protein
MIDTVLACFSSSFSDSNPIFTEILNETGMETCLNHLNLCVLKWKSDYAAFDWMTAIE